ncbi:MAG: murein transglycosylase A [Rhodobacteraceae bacterium]|nr:murein transglycosylase A [Paracoccaceae bacterium]
MRHAVLAASLMANMALTEMAQAEAHYTLLEFKDLPGWAADDHDAALSVFLNTCGDMREPEWKSVCNVAQQTKDARIFFELFFRPVKIDDGDPGLFTGYFEPELMGSRLQTDRFRYPLYAMPPELRGKNELWYSRAEIENRGILRGRDLEIAWVEDPVELFFLQIQGSGRIRLPDGNTVRVGYAGKNGHNYRSVGQEMIRRGIYEPHQVSAKVIQNWVRRNPEDGRRLLQHNPSYVFFRELDDLGPEFGPRGAMNRSITGGRSIAVDPAFVPLGAPVWIQKGGRDPLLRLMIAQDTGSAIKGAQRADIFYGTGEEAGRAAGSVRDPGRMYVLMPIQRALALAGNTAG